MGNQSIGNAMHRAAQEAVRCRQPGETALDLLDRVCNPYRNRDAEFTSTDPDDPTAVHPEYDDYRDPHLKAPMGMLMLEAFAPHGVVDLERYAPMLGCEDADAHEAACDAWWEEVCVPFRKRYEFW